MKEQGEIGAYVIRCATKTNVDFFAQQGRNKTAYQSINMELSVLHRLRRMVSLSVACIAGNDQSQSIY